MNFYFLYIRLRRFDPHKLLIHTHTSIHVLHSTLYFTFAGKLEARVGFVLYSP